MSNPKSRLSIVTITDPKEAREAVKQTEERFKNPVLAEVELHVFRGATLYLLKDRDKILSYNVSRIGKRKKNIWEPYVNWYTAYTLKDHRRQGHATRLAEHVKTAAKVAGCRRLKALAGTYVGLMLHASLGDEFWGITEKNEVVVDTPLIDDLQPIYHGKIPPNAVDGVKKHMSVKQVLNALQGTQLRYEATNVKKPQPSKEG